MTLDQKVKIKTSLHAQSTCDETNVCVYIDIYLNLHVIMGFN